MERRKFTREFKLDVVAPERPDTVRDFHELR